MTPTRQTFGERCPAIMYTDVSQLCVIIRNASNQICLVSSPTQPQYDLPYLQINDTVNDRHAVEELIRAELGVHCSLESEPFASTEEWKENIHQTCDYYLARMMPGDFSRSCTQRLVWTTVEGACDQLQAQGQERSACALSQLLNAQAPTPLAPMDPNARLAMAATAPSSFAEAVKPVPSFAQESQQHNYLHSKVLAQERYVSILPIP